MQFAEGISFLGIGLRRYSNQGSLVTTLRQMAIDCVVTEIGLTTDEPACEWWSGKIQGLIERGMPIDTLCFIGPEAIWVIDGLLIERGETHDVSS